MPPKKISRSARAGLTMPVGRTASYLRKGLPRKMRITANHEVWFTAVLEYVVSTLIAGVVEEAKEDKKKKVTPRHVMLALHKDRDIDAFFGHPRIVGAGVRPGIPKIFLPKPSRKKKDMPVEE